MSHESVKDDVNQAAEVSGNTELHYAAFEEDISSINFLLRKGANPNQKNKKNETPLHFAVVSKNWKIVKLFIQHLIDTQQDFDCTEIIQNAENSNNHDMLNFLSKKGLYSKPNNTVKHNHNSSAGDEKKMTFPEPSAPPFEGTNDEWLTQYHIWVNVYKPLNEIAKTTYLQETSPLISNNSHATVSNSPQKNYFSHNLKPHSTKTTKKQLIGIRENENKKNHETSPDTLNVAKPEHENAKSSKPISSSSSNTNSTHTTTSDTMLKTTPQKNQSPQNLKSLSIKKIRKQLINNKKSKDNKIHEASLDILLEADKQGYLPELWEENGQNSALNRYMRRLIRETIEIIKDAKEKVKISSENQSLFFHLSPFRNLQNAYLPGINFEGYYLYDVNLEGADLTGAQIGSSCINVQNLLLTKSLRGLKVDQNIIRLSTPLINDPILKFTGVKPVTLPVKLDNQKIKKIQEKIVADYKSYFKDCNTNPRLIQESLKELNSTASSKSFVRDSDQPSTSSSTFAFLKSSTPHQEIKKAAQDEIEYKKSLGKNTNESDFQSIANAYSGNH